MKWIKTETINVKLLVPSGLTLAGMIGGVVGYVVASKTLEKKYRELADKEIQEAKVYYQGMYSRPVMVAEEHEEVRPAHTISPVELFEDLDPEIQQRVMSEAVKALQTYKTTDEVVADRPEVNPSTVVNVFTSNQPPGEAVLEALLADRDPASPYIITKEEYFLNEPDHEQRQFTFYAGDSVLVDDAEEYDPILDTESVAGDDNLMRFGYGSGDEHTLYIRNETKSPPFDLYITRSVGRYTDEVMGFSEHEDGPPLKHSQQRKFRIRDE